jgi:hypothetical protein
MTRTKWFRTIDIAEEEGGGHFALLTKCDLVGFQRVGHPICEGFFVPSVVL